MDDSVPKKLQQYCSRSANGSCIKGNQTMEIQVMLYILFVPATIFTILGNLVVIISIAHFKQLHTPTNILVMSLALGDLLLGVIVMPFSMLKYLAGCCYFGYAFCLVVSSFAMFLTSVSIFHLIFIAIDRYQAVCNPLHYSTRITIPIAGLMSVLSWVFAGIYTYGVLFSNLYLFFALWGAVDSLIAFFLPCLVMMGLYAKIFLVAREHVRKIEDMNQKTSVNGENKNKLSRRSERKAAKTLGIVMSVFILSWLPFFISALIDQYTNLTTPTILYFLLVWLAFFNSTLNPAIYALFYPWFQKSLTLIITFKIFTPHSSDMNVFPEK